MREEDDRNATPVWKLFEDLVRRILEARGHIVNYHSPRGDLGFDFIGDLQNERWAIEVKYYRTARAQPALIEAAANRLANNGVREGARKGMLVVSCVLPIAQRLAFEETYSINLVDRIDLGMLASIDPRLAEELDALVEVHPAVVLDALAFRDFPLWGDRVLPDAVAPLLEARGAELCAELRAVKRGRTAWSSYESVCERILKYLFPNDLHGWYRQKRTDDGLCRYDFVCRVRPAREFWKFLIDHLNSRYVIFEFKNYSGKIKQGQILTTEKYLLERGLRRVAIIFTRVGAEKDAVRMTQGAMREHGKLMLIINDEMVCDMLHMKDRGDDPTDCLFDAADNFLLTLPR